MPFLQLHPDLPKFGFGADYVPPAAEKAAVPVVTTPTGAGQSVGHLPLPCFFPQPELHPRVVYSGTGQWSPVSCLRSDFNLTDMAAGSHLDAGSIPLGGVYACQIAGNFVARVSTVWVR